MKLISDVTIRDLEIELHSDEIMRVIREQVNKLYPSMRGLTIIEGGAAQVEYGRDVHTGQMDYDIRPSTERERRISECMQFVRSTLHDKQFYPY